MKVELEYLVEYEDKCRDLVKERNLYPSEAW